MPNANKKAKVHADMQLSQNLVLDITYPKTKKDVQKLKKSNYFNRSPLKEKNVKYSERNLHVFGQIDEQNFQTINQKQKTLENE